MDGLIGRLITAVIRGVIIGVVVAVLLFIISALLPRVEIDASWWGVVAGILAALYSFFQPHTKRS